tara:strand:- start:41 stop:472 length:432 start_codon:yes stop_codon:yes gene_type:complete
MAITQTMCTSFKKALLDGEMDFSANTNQAYKIALYTNSASLDATTAVYTTSNEASGTGYTAGGVALTISTVPTTSGTTAYLSFSNATWANSTITARGALIYQTGGTTPAVAVLDFGSDKVTSGATFQVTFPTANSTTAIVRVA